MTAKRKKNRKQENNLRFIIALILVIKINEPRLRED